MSLWMCLDVVVVEFAVDAVVAVVDVVVVVAADLGNLGNLNSSSVILEA